MRSCGCSGPCRTSAGTSQTHLGAERTTGAGSVLAVLPGRACCERSSRHDKRGKDCADQESLHLRWASKGWGRGSITAEPEDVKNLGTGCKDLANHPFG